MNNPGQQLMPVPRFSGDWQRAEPLPTPSTTNYTAQVTLHVYNGSVIINTVADASVLARLQEGA
eukprot:1143946-Pelagomonas_calceolata.AAC.3